MEARHEWLDDALRQHARLTVILESLLKSLLDVKGVNYLAVTGRTKDRNGVIEKINRKQYKNPSEQLTDLTGIRIIVFFESDVNKVCEIINDSFSVDIDNSLNKDDLLPVNQIGYRSVHFVCDIGRARSKLPEFKDLAKLKFEFQVRTILQHAWAELAHGRNYKFTEKLPREMERQIYLYAGMLEIADKGFDKLASDLDSYTESIREKTEAGDLSPKIDSISLEQFVSEWSKKAGFPLKSIKANSQIGQLIQELEEFGVDTLSQLNKIIPKKYAEIAENISYTTNIFGLVRDWMMICDWRRFAEDVEINWVLAPGESKMLKKFMSDDEFHEMHAKFGDHDHDHDPD